MVHTQILLMVMALALGAGSIAVTWRYLWLYRLDFIRYLIVFLVALNLAAVAGILFNYYGENLKTAFSAEIYRTVDTAYRLVADVLLLAIGGSLVLMLRALVDETPSRRYLTVLACAWAVIFAANIATAVFPVDAGPVPSTVWPNIVLDQLVQYLVLFECIRAFRRTSGLPDHGRRYWTRLLLSVFGVVWLAIIVLAFLMFTDQSESRLYNLLSAVVYVIFNALPLAFLGLFLRQALGSPAPASSGPSDRVEALFDRYGVSKREREIVDLIHKGYSNKKIADELHISVSTVKDHNHNVFRKLDVGSRTQLIARLYASND